MRLTSVIFCLAITVPSLSQNQNPKPAPPLTYGEPIKLDQAEKVIAAALQEAKNNSWMMAIAIVDTSGKLVLFKKMDNTQIGSVDVAIGKATTANNFKRPSKVFEDAVAGGGMGLRILSLPGVTPRRRGTNYARWKNNRCDWRFRRIVSTRRTSCPGGHGCGQLKFKT
jgi:hypothetical protein